MSDQSDDRPNVLLICTDHWGAPFQRAAGHPVVMTPTIDALARSGVRFSNAYSACPTCVPARRSLMTGLSSRTHGDRVFKERERMPNVPTMAQCFRDAGYQAYAVGKLHVHPQRDRIGFDDVINNEEGRHHLGDDAADDWELYLQEQGYAGQEYASGMCNNDFMTRAWHLPEHCHPTNWTAAQMCKTMHRRDRTRPAFWYMSFIGPHQPVWPLRDYIDLYRDVPMDEPVFGDWSRDYDNLPYTCRRRMQPFGIRGAPGHEVEIARRNFYATITHIDHQIRVVIGYLREQGLLDNTIIAFISDHGEMLGDHHLWTKAFMYDGSNKIPMILSPPSGDDRFAVNTVDDRLVEIRDVMPTLLDAAGVDIPDHVEGLSLLRDERRDYLYGEHFEGAMSTRMIRGERYKLIYYAVGNVFQLFDMQTDPRETHDLSDDPAHAEVRQRLTKQLIDELYGEDRQWLDGEQLVGLPQPASVQDYGHGTRGLMGQRGLRFM